MQLKVQLIGFITVVQSILLAAHFFLYETWVFAGPGNHTGAAQWFFGVVSFSFVAASLLAFRYTNAAVRFLYRLSAIWLGLLTFLIVAAVLSWSVFGIARLTGASLNFHHLVEWLFVAAAVTGFYGIFNASWTRITRARVQLANLPAAWRGRKAALISDVHLGHVRNRNFLQRLVAKILQEEPHAVFIVGDLFDGTAIDAAHAAAPLSKIAAPQGVYFVAGNHEQFGDDNKFLQAISSAGVRVLTNEKVDVDGLQIIGVPYRSATRAGHLASALKSIGPDPHRASILLTHAPDYPHIAEAAGISLQLSGHTHVGQFIPWSWLARRVYRQFVYGLSRLGNMQIFTSSGAGTWGPPLRLGSNPEIVLLQFE